MSNHDFACSINDFGTIFKYHLSCKSLKCEVKHLFKVCHGLSIFEEIEQSVKVLDDVCSYTTVHNNNGLQH